MAINGPVRDTNIPSDFPLPTMPDTTYETISSCTIEDDGYVQSKEELKKAYDHHVLGALRECLEEIDTKGKELLKKLFSDEDAEITLGRLVREVIGDSRATDFLEKLREKIGEKMKSRKAKNSIVAGRGLSDDDLDSTMEELNQKLERFKVKTVNIGGVAKEDKK